MKYNCPRRLKDVSYDFFNTVIEVTHFQGYKEPKN
jgi:hypothetical protein